MYTEHRSPLVPAMVWTIPDSSGGLVLPDGCMDLIWFGDRLIVAGPDTRPHQAEPPVSGDLVGLRFAPGVAPSVLGLPASEVRDSRVPLDAVWDPRTVRRLQARLADSPDVAGDLEAIARQRLLAAEPLPSSLGSTVAMIREGRRVADVASHVGLSERQLHRRSLAAFGYGPKVLGRILRFRRAADLLRSGRSKAEVAALAGYADQPHLTREFRAFSVA